MLQGMGLVLRDHRSAYGFALARIGGWPGRVGVAGRQRGRMAGRVAALGGDPALAAHVVRVWDSSREQVARGAFALEKECGRDGLPGSVDLEFLSALGAHVVGCRWSESCGAWLSWGVGSVRTLRDAFGALGGSWGRFPPGHAAALRVAAAGRRAEQADALDGAHAGHAREA